MVLGPDVDLDVALTQTRRDRVGEEGRSAGDAAAVGYPTPNAERQPG